MTKDTCPNCENSFSSIGVHWGKSSTCSHPSFTPEQKAILEGLFMSGGTFIDIESPKNPGYRIVSTDQSLLQWVAEQFPLLGRGVTEKMSAEESAESLRERFPEQKRVVSEQSETSPVYQWETRSTPHLTPLYARWTDDTGERRVPETYSPSALTLAVAYSFCGRIDTHGAEATEFSATFATNSTAIPVEDWQYVLQRFEPSVHYQYTRPVVVLRDSVVFFDRLRGVGDMDSAWIPTESTIRKWPTAETPLTKVGSEAEVCPTCGKRFKGLGMHWREEPCSPPKFSTEQFDFLSGMLLVSGSVSDKGNGHPRVVFRLVNREFAEWFDEWLGVLGTGVQRFDRDEARGRDTECIVKTRRHSQLGPFEEWYRNGRKTDIDESMKRTPAVLRGMYSRVGSFEEETALRSVAQVSLSIARSPASDSMLERLLEPFDVEIIHGKNSRRAVCHDTDAFFEYIGREPVGGCEEKWPTEV